MWGFVLIFGRSEYLCKPILFKRPTYDVINLSMGPFKVHKIPMNFNKIWNIGWYDFRFHTVTFKKQPLAEFWCGIKEYLQLSIMTTTCLCKARDSSCTSIMSDSRWNKGTDIRIYYCLLIWKLNRFAKMLSNVIPVILFSFFGGDCYFHKKMLSMLVYNGFSAIILNCFRLFNYFLSFDV